jgi:hypothetical protein
MGEMQGEQPLANLIDCQKAIRPEYLVNREIGKLTYAFLVIDSLTRGQINEARTRVLMFQGRLQGLSPDSSLLKRPPRDYDPQAAQVLTQEMETKVQALTKSRPNISRARKLDRLVNIFSQYGLKEGNAGEALQYLVACEVISDIGAYPWTDPKIQSVDQKTARQLGSQIEKMIIRRIKLLNFWAIIHPESETIKELEDTYNFLAHNDCCKNIWNKIVRRFGYSNEQQDVILPVFGKEKAKQRMKLLINSEPKIILPEEMKKGLAFN